MERFLIPPFRIRCEWLHSEHGSAEERATLAELALSVYGYCATELDDTLAKTVRRTARLSALHLAEWFAVNWWRLLWEPKASDLSWQMSHKIGAAGAGYIWPDLSFSSDWESVLVSARRTEPSEAQPIRYLNDFSVSIPVEDFKRGIEDFMIGTIARLTETVGRETGLSGLWSAVVDERRDDALARWRKLEACMGYDPDEAPRELLDNLQDAIGTYGDGAVHELAAACKNDTLPQIETLADETRCKHLNIRLASYDTLSRRIADECSAPCPPWKRAKKAAGIARSVWNVDGPISTRMLADLFEVDDNELSERLTDGPPLLSAGLRDHDDPARMRISWNIRSPSARRFSLARLVADHLASPPEERLLPATRMITSRQQFQRAFAQEFLCPYDKLQDVIGPGSPSVDDVEYAAKQFDVSTWVIVCALVNNGVLSREELMDWGVT